MVISSISNPRTFAGSYNKQVEKEVLNSLGKGVKALSNYHKVEKLWFN